MDSWWASVEVKHAEAETSMEAEHEEFEARQASNHAQIQADATRHQIEEANRLFMEQLNRPFQM